MIIYKAIMYCQSFVSGDYAESCLRSFAPLKDPESAAECRQKAQEHGWTYESDGNRGFDFCPRCSAREEKQS